MKINSTFLDLEVSTEILEEWGEWISHDITMYYKRTDNPRTKGVKVAIARVTRCVALYDEAGHDTWDRTQELWNFHNMALTTDNIKHFHLEAALCNHVTYIEKLEVMEKYRQQGLATYLLRKIIAYLADPAGIIGLQLPKGKEDTWLEKFYEIYGFDRLGNGTFMVKNCQLTCEADQAGK